MLKKSIKLSSLVCLIISFTLISNTVFAGTDLDRALSPEVNPVNTKNYSNIVKNKYIKGDLIFLQEFSDEDLMPLVNIMRNRLTNQLPDDVVEHPRVYLSQIINELEKYAGNTLMNIFRGGKGVSYREMLEDVCKKQNIEIENNMSVDRMGYALVEHTFETALNNMTVAQKEEFFNSLEETMGKEDYEKLLKEAGGKAGLWALSGNALTMLLVKSAGFGLYKISAIIVFGLFHSLGYSVPHWLAFGGLATIIKTGTGFLFGPIVWTILGIWGTINIASPATRVTVPATLYIESMRIVTGNNSYVNFVLIP